MTSTTKVRIAVAGAGAIGARHIEVVEKSRGAMLTGIVDLAPHAATLAARAHVPLYNSLAALFADRRVEGVILATPNALHVAQGLECIAARVPVLVEKPVAPSFLEGLRLCEAAEAAEVPILVGHHRRHNPILAKAIEVVRSGILGRIVAVIGSATFFKPDSYFEGAYAWRRHAGGGPILINLTHEIDNLRAMIGEIVAVQALASNATRGFEVEDTVAINLRFGNGALGTFMLSDTAASAKSWEHTAGENPAYPHCPDEDAYTIMGTNGSLSVPTMRLRHHEQPSERSWFHPMRTQILASEHRDPLVLQVEHFVAVIREGALPRVSCRDGLQNVRIAEAIARAAREGGTVDIEPPGPVRAATPSTH